MKSFPTMIAALLLVGLAACNKTNQNPEGAAAKAGEAAAAAGEAASAAGEAAAAKAGEAATKAGEAAGAAGEAAALAGSAAASKAAEVAAIAEAKAAEAGAVAADEVGAAAAAAGEAAGTAAGVAAEAAAGVANAAAGAATAAAAAVDSAALLAPSKATAGAPATFKVRFTTTKGAFDILVHRDWAPKGADRFFNLVKIGYFTDIAFFRAIEGFMVQFGVHGDPKVATAWRTSEFGDDPVKESNKRGRLTFATRGKDTRTTQMFINFKDNAMLDGMGFTPIGEVDETGMKVVDSLYTGYGEGAPRGQGPDQMLVQMQGNAYLKADFPKLDYLVKAEIVD